MEKEVSEAERRVKIKKTYSEKINLLVKQDIDEKGLYDVIRKFFSDFLKLEYEFTYEELSQELNKVFIKQALKKRIDKMLGDLSLLEYMPDHELGQEEKKKILADFKDLIDQLILDYDKKPEKVSFFGKLFGKKKKEEATSSQTPDQEIDNEPFPELNLEAADKRNNEIKETSGEKMVQKEISADVLGGLISKSGESNNLLLAIEPPEEKISKKKLSKENYNPSKKEASLPQNISSKDSPKTPENMRTFISPPPMLEDNDLDLVAIRELIEKSYNVLSSGDIESAKYRYMDTLAIYNKLDYSRKTKIYLELYDLYKKLI